MARRANKVGPCQQARAVWSRVLLVGCSGRRRLNAADSDKVGAMARLSMASIRLVSLQRQSSRGLHDLLDVVSPGGNALSVSDQASHKEGDQEFALKPTSGGLVIVFFQVTELDERLQALELQLDLPT